MEGIWGRVQAEVDAREGRIGLRTFDLLELPQEEGRLMRRLLKEKFISLRDAAAELGQTEEQATQTLDALVERTYLIEFEKNEEKHYKILLAHKAGKELPFNIWDALTDKTSR